MKKLLIAAAIVSFAAVTNAATFKWQTLTQAYGPSVANLTPDASGNYAVGTANTDRMKAEGSNQSVVWTYVMILTSGANSETIEGTVPRIRQTRYLRISPRRTLTFHRMIVLLRFPGKLFLREQRRRTMEPTPMFPIRLQEVLFILHCPTGGLIPVHLPHGTSRFLARLRRSSPSRPPAFWCSSASPAWLSAAARKPIVIA